MEERARLKALEALFDPTTTARIVALPAADEVVIAIEASPVSQYDLMMMSGHYGYRRHLPPKMGTEGVGRAIAVGNAPNDAVEQALSKRVSRSWYAASAKFARNCNRHVNRKE
jgi:NADPH:quinone reductase-like Zn-dependent oxidoreductase